VTRLKREFEELGVDMSGTENANFTRTETDRSRFYITKKEIVDLLYKKYFIKLLG